MPKLDLYPLPQHAPREALADATVIVVDLLRASTTICVALAAGATCVMPFATIGETWEAAERFGRENVLLGGERHGKLIPGFDLGNSPAEYTNELIDARRILFTTTNGARALDHVRTARRVLVGAAVNRLTLLYAVERDADVAIVCAGTDGEVAREDLLAGGAIIDGLIGNAKWGLNKAASEALSSWLQLCRDAEDAARSLNDQFAIALTETQGGRNLMEIGQNDDLPTCARFDVLDVVPQLNRANELRRA